jgi:nicotinamidase-related amidase
VGFQFDLPRAALVITDPQVDFLSPGGIAWGAVGESVARNNTVENIERLLRAARQTNMVVAISPHYYYPSDHRWGFGGRLETLMQRAGADPEGPPLLAGSASSGGDLLPRYRPYLIGARTILASPHRAYGPDGDDLVMQLRRHRIDQVVLAGMLANLCVESHLRALVERGFEVAVVKDATAGAPLADLDGYQAAIINFRYIADALWSTEEAVASM